MAEIEISQLAKDDLNDIWKYFAGIELELALGFMQRFRQKLDLLSVNTGIGRSADQLVAHLRKFNFENYLILYFPRRDGIEIYRVLHKSRDIEGLFKDYFENL